VRGGRRCGGYRLKRDGTDATIGSSGEEARVRLLVAGASGRTGRLLVERALEHGHEVTALVRDATAFPDPPERLKVVVGDVLAPETLAPAIAGQDAVVSVIAPRPRNSGRVYVEGMRNLADAAARAGVRRFVAVSAEGAGAGGSRLPAAYRLVMLIPVVARLYPAIAHMEADLRVRDDLDWTVVRPPILTNGPRTGGYRVVRGAVVPRGLRLPRADLADFLLKLAESGDHVRESVAIAR
jgi:putative NADH-flavin reductase